MADLPFDITTFTDPATGAIDPWVSIAVELVVGTIIGGILLINVLGVFNKIYGDILEYKRSFLVVGVANMINLVGLRGFISPMLKELPAAEAIVEYAIPAVIWVFLLKVFFEDMNLTHATVVGIVFFGITLILVPTYVNMALGYIFDLMQGNPITFP
jgi:hypothetical protein